MDACFDLSRRSRTTAAFVLALGLVASAGLAANAAAAHSFATVDPGHLQTCGLTTAGGAKCWGYSFEGQVGDDTMFERWTPVDVSGLASGVAAVATGANHACALTIGGSVMCWGDSLNGAVGDGTNAKRYAPVAVVGLAPALATQISAGPAHTCVVLELGGVRCWGNGIFGQLGNGIEDVQYTAVAVAGLGAPAASVSAGGNHTCAVMADGTLKCWGLNAEGQVGTGVNPPDNNMLLAPTDVVGLGTTVTAVAAGFEHTCALTTAGGVKCWGRNVSGQLGDGTQTRRLAPVDVAGLTSGVVAITAGDTHTCALTSAGGVKCWGQAPLLGINDGSGAIITTPADVVGLASGVVGISAGPVHTCAVTTTGAARCWGRGENGRLGNDTSPTFQLVPTAGTVARDVVPIFNTGVDASGAPLAGGLVDPHYALVASADPSFPGPDAVVATNITFPYVPNDARSQWIAASPVQDLPTTGHCNPAGFYTYRTTLDLTGFDPATVNISGLWSTDDQGTDISVNGVSTNYSSNGYGQWWRFRLNASFVAGMNTIEFRTRVFECPAGLRVMMSATGSPPVAPDTTPDAFSFASQLDVATASTRTSAPAVPVGYNAPATVSVANGEYSVGCTASYTSLAGSISPGQSVCVRHLSAAGAGATVTTTLIVGGVSATFSSTTAAAALPGNLAWSAGGLDFGGQSLRTTAPASVLTLSNTGGTTVDVTSITVTTHFGVAHGCTTLAPGATCSVTVTFRPLAAGSLAGTLTATFAGGTRTVTLAGIGEGSLTTHYYRAILRRAPDAGGKAFWEGEAARMLALGANVNETWNAMAKAFFASGEYVALARNDSGFVTDLYKTFFDRAPDAGGLAFWIAQLQQGAPRELLLVSFMFSPEFSAVTRAIFGDPASRPEVDMVVDFYRGLLARLPDDSGFAFWRDPFRAAQCDGAPAVAARAEQISAAFTLSGEYAARARSNAEFVGDLYNAFLRRGGDLPGVQYWIDALASGGSTREQVRQAFVASPEFQGRVQSVIAAGCSQ